MRRICFAFLVARGLATTGQMGLPQLPDSGGSIADFIPDGWAPLDTAIGDLNNDRRDDVVLVLQCLDTIPGDTTGIDPYMLPSPPRKLAVLLATENGFRIALDNDRFILRASEGGWLDPFEGVEVKDGLLVIHFYGGSAWRNSNTYTFRFDQGAFALIVAEAVEYHVYDGIGVSYSLDFLTHRVTVTTGNKTENEAGNETHEEDLPEMELRTFDTFVRPYTWRIDDGLTL